MKNNLKRAVIPLLASLFMVLAIGGYYTYAMTITVNGSTNDSNIEQPNESPQPTSNPDSVIINGKEIKKEENGCATNGGLSICSNPNIPPTTQPQQPSEYPALTGSNSNSCKQVCIGYKTVCE